VRIRLLGLVAIVLLAAACAVGASGAPSERAAVLGEPPNVELLVDLSGSMNEPVPGLVPAVSKYDHLLAALGGYLGALPPESVVAVRVFGLVGCEPSELIRPPAPVGERGRQDILERLHILHPGGATPLARAIREAGAEVRTGVWTILILSDGGDSCEGPEAVCRAAEGLVAQGATVRIDLAQVFIPPAERDALRCAPAATGGRMTDLDQVAPAVRLATLVPLRALVALLVILLGWATFFGLSDLLSEAFRRLLRGAYAGLVADGAFLAAATGWAVYWTEPVVHLPLVVRVVLGVVGLVLVFATLRRHRRQEEAVPLPPELQAPDPRLGMR
jgi:hypothetical protein